MYLRELKFSRLRSELPVYIKWQQQKYSQLVSLNELRINSLCRFGDELWF